MHEDIMTLRVFDAGFPKKLNILAAKPDPLYLKGSLPSADLPTVSIVGSRSCSTYGKQQALRFARVLAANGVQIVSGLAGGIDSYAHQGAIEGGGKTFAVLGCGVDICYPRQNEKLYRKILDTGGGILSEFSPGTPALSHHFPTRNRIISAFCDVCLIIEARIRSGSLITANHALEQGKTIYALPGRIDDLRSRGCNMLISQGAFLAISPEQLLSDLCISAKKEEDKIHPLPDTALNKELNKVLRHLSSDPKPIHVLLDETKLSVEKLTILLLKLELSDLIFEPVPGMYCRANR